MPEYGRVKRLILGQGGSTLAELLVAMPMAIALLFAILYTFSTAAHDQQRVERRTEAVADAQRGLERMTREVRQADWVYFRSSQVIDVDAFKRPNPGSSAAHRLVRYDCSTDHCLRLEGPPVPFPPPPLPAFETSSVLVGTSADDETNTRGRLLGQAVFDPRRVDPVTGASQRDYLNPDLLLIRLWLKIDLVDRPVELVDGVSLRNNSRFR